MKICKVLFLLLTLSVILSCGVKAPPVPTESFLIPYPQSFRVSIQSGGISITNESAQYTMLIEKAEDSSSIFKNNIFSHLTLLPPKATYTDSKVLEGVTYTYSFKNFYQEYNTYSQSAYRTIKYITPVSLDKVSIVEHSDSACVVMSPSVAVDYALLTVNNKEIGIMSDDETCFNLPNSLNVDILIVPYDADKKPGVPYRTTFKRDENIVLLPPQNIRAIREKTKVILTWDTGAKDIEYQIYLKKSDKLQLLTKTNITLYSYDIKDDNRCIDFVLSGIKNDNESAKVNVTSCP